MAQQIKCKYDDEVCPYYDDETKAKDKICLECKLPDPSEYQGKRQDQIESSAKIVACSIIALIALAVIGVVTMIIERT